MFGDSKAKPVYRSRFQTDISSVDESDDKSEKVDGIQDCTADADNRKNSKESPTKVLSAPSDSTNQHHSKSHQFPKPAATISASEDEKECIQSTKKLTALKDCSPSVLRGRILPEDRQIAMEKTQKICKESKKKRAKSQTTAQTVSQNPAHPAAQQSWSIGVRRPQRAQTMD